MGTQKNIVPNGRQSFFKYIEPKRVRSKMEQIEYKRHKQRVYMKAALKAHRAKNRAEQHLVANGLEAARVVDVGLVGEEVD